MENLKLKTSQIEEIGAAAEFLSVQKTKDKDAAYNMDIVCEMLRGAIKSIAKIKLEIFDETNGNRETGLHNTVEDFQKYQSEVGDFMSKEREVRIPTFTRQQIDGFAEVTPKVYKALSPLISDKEEIKEFVIER